MCENTLLPRFVSVIVNKSNVLIDLSFISLISHQSRKAVIVYKVEYLIVIVRLVKLLFLFFMINLDMMFEKMFIVLGMNANFDDCIIQQLVSTRATNDGEFCEV